MYRHSGRVGSTRFGSIDAVRGVAMLFVFLSHFIAGYTWKGGAHQTVASYLTTLSMIASPTFVIVSGMVVGFLAATNPLGFGQLRLKLIDRGIFVLIFGHLALTLALAPSFPDLGRAVRTSFITDAIAVAIIVGPSLVESLRPSGRLALAISLFLFDWSAVLGWHPTGGALIAKLYLFGRLSTSGELGAYPVFAVVPWFAVYVAGTVIGEHFGGMYRRGNLQAAHKYLAKCGAVSVMIGGAAQALTMTLRRSDVLHSQANLLNLLSIYQKFPPGLIFLGFFGGSGLLMFATVLEIDRRRKFSTAIDALRTIGRASLFMFTAQYWLYRTMLGRVGVPYTPAWPLIFVLSVIVLARLAAIWDKHSCNRLLTVGLTSPRFRTMLGFSAPSYARGVGKLIGSPLARIAHRS